MRCTITDKRAIALLIAIDDLVHCIALTQRAPERVYLIGTPFRLYVILADSAMVYGMARAYEWVDCVELFGTIIGRPFTTLFDRRIYPRGFFTLGKARGHGHE